MQKLLTGCLLLGLALPVTADVQINIRDVARIDPPIDQPMLRFVGSNTVGEKLIPMIAESYVVAGGGSDANILCSQGRSCLIIGTGMNNVHTTEESIDLQDMVRTAELVMGILTT